MKKTQWERGEIREDGNYIRCSICGKLIHSLGWASHKTGHHNKALKEKVKK